MKGTLIVLALSCVATSYATYEMLLVADSGGAGIAPKVHRFDPVSRNYLGAFGEGILTDPRGVEVDSNGIAWVGELGDYIRLFNAHTGEYLGAVVHGVGATPYGRILQGKYFRNSSSTLFAISTANYAATNLSTGGAAHFVAPWSSTEFFTSRGTNVLLRINATTNGIVSTQTLTTEVSIFYTDAVVVNDSLGSTTRKLYVGRPFDATNDLSVYTMNSSGSITSSLNRNLATLNSVYGLAKAHRGLYAAGVLASDATKGGITFIDDLGNEMYTFGSSFLKSPKGMASVVAPEPGTLLAIGVGLAALARTRKRRT